MAGPIDTNFRQRVFEKYLYSDMSSLRVNVGEKMTASETTEQGHGRTHHVEDHYRFEARGRSCARRIGRPPQDPVLREQKNELERVKRENAKVQERLDRAGSIIDAKKLAEVLDSLREASGSSE